MKKFLVKTFGAMVLVLIGVVAGVMLDGKIGNIEFTDRMKEVVDGSPVAVDEDDAKYQKEEVTQEVTKEVMQETTQDVTEPVTEPVTQIIEEPETTKPAYSEEELLQMQQEEASKQRKADFIAAMHLMDDYYMKGDKETAGNMLNEINLEYRDEYGAAIIEHRQEVLKYFEGKNLMGQAPSDFNRALGIGVHEIGDLDSVKDAFGNTYKDFVKFRVDYKDDAGYITYYNDGTYTNYRAKYILDGEMNIIDKFRLEVYGDNNLLYTASALDKLTEPTEIDLNIEGYKFIQVKVIREAQYYSGHGAFLALVESALYSKNAEFPVFDERKLK